MDLLNTEAAKPAKGLEKAQRKMLTPAAAFLIVGNYPAVSRKNMP
jgi:hypothetical protein